MLASLSPSRSLFVGLFLALGLLNGWAVWHWSASRQQAVAATQRLNNAAAIKAQILQLRKNPILAEASTRTHDAMAQLVQEAAQKALLPTDRIADIASGDLRRLGDTDYQEQNTTVTLRNATLPQVTQFTLAISAIEPDMKTPKILLRTPSGLVGNDQPEVWDAILVLTNRIYAPKSE